jgi:hypothetical protein
MEFSRLSLGPSRPRLFFALITVVATTAAFGQSPTADAMPATLDALLAKGYKFVTVSELIAMNHPKASPTPSSSASTKK